MAPGSWRLRAAADERLPWKLLGTHSARLDLARRDTVQDGSLGLNYVWYADILMTMTQDDAGSVDAIRPP